MDNFMRYWITLFCMGIIGMGLGVYVDRATRNSKPEWSLALTVKGGEVSAHLRDKHHDVIYYYETDGEDIVPARGYSDKQPVGDIDSIIRLAIRENLK